MKRITWIILLLIFSLALAACGGDEPETAVDEPAAQEEASPAQEEAPAAEPTAVPPEAPEPVEETQTDVEEEIAFDNIHVSSLDELTSYRYDVVINFTGADAEGVETTQTMHMEMAVSTDPPATSMKMTTESTDDTEEMGTMEFVTIEDTSYIVMAEMGCMTLPAGEDSGMGTEDFTNDFSPEAITENLENVTLVGKETIDGVAVLHYAYDETALQGEEAMGVISAEGHLYVAEDGGYLVRSIMDVTGNSAFIADTEDEEFQSATTHIEMNLRDVNEAVEIVLPDACEGQEAGSADWPMLEDASTISSFAGIVSYTSETAVADVIAFYDTEMMALGYTQNTESSYIAEDTGILTYANEDGEEVSITIAKDSASGLTTVTILSDPGF